MHVIDQINAKYIQTTGSLFASRFKCVAEKLNVTTYRDRVFEKSILYSYFCAKANIYLYCEVKYRIFQFNHPVTGEIIIGVLFPLNADANEFYFLFFYFE